MDLKNLIEYEGDRIELYRSQHKTCILTIVFADIVGYSRLCERLPAHTIGELILKFEELSREIFETKFGGLVLKYVGDAVLAVFAEPVSSVQAAMEFAIKLGEHGGFGVPIRLRTGIHMGTVALEAKGLQADIFGKHVNRTSRIQTACAPGEILVSEPVRDNVIGFHPESFALTPQFIRRRHIIAKNINEPLFVHTLIRQKDDAPQQEELDTAYIRIRMEYLSPDADPEDLEITVFDPINTRSILIGRDEICDIRIEEDHISRRHAMINFGNDNRWYLQDNQSRNGTFLNGAFTTSAPLKVGDRIQLGDHALMIIDLCDTSPGTMWGTKMRETRSDYNCNNNLNNK